MEITPEQWNRDITNYVMINNDFYKRLHSDPTKLNPTPVQKSTLKSKYGFIERDLETVPELDGFICEPLHGENYREVVNNCWNTYDFVEWNPQPGKWPTIEKLINHLYGDNGVEPDQREELYDYHTLLIKHPKQRLFCRILYSHHQGTSKSSLGFLEQLMFQGNYSKVRDTELESTFNSVWAEALVIHLDEPSFEKPKRAARDIRDMVTMETVNVRKMREEYKQIDFYGKILITTNDSDFMPIEKSDRRYWVREIPPIKEGDKDPYFQEKMRKEVNHYIHFLLNRKMKWEKKVDATFWIPYDAVQTNGLKKLIGDNTASDERQLIEWFEDWFLRDKKRDHLTFNLKDLQTSIEWEGKEPSTKRLAVILRDGMGIKQPNKPRRLAKGESYIDMGSNSIYTVGRFWTVKRSQFNLEVDIFNDIKFG